MNQDDLLGLLISVAESGGARFPVILSVGGNIIEGEVVTEREYFEEMASMIGGDPDSKEVFANIPGWMDEAAMRGLDEGRPGGNSGGQRVYGYLLHPPEELRAVGGR